MAAKLHIEEARKFLHETGMARYGWLPAELQVGLHALHRESKVTTKELLTIGRNLVALAAHKKFILRELMPRAASSPCNTRNARSAVDLLLRHTASQAALLSLVPPKLQVQLHHGFACHVGKVRPKNEDAVLIESGKTLYLVADGIGGTAAGEVAAREAVVKAAQVFNGGKRRELVVAVQTANTHIYGLNQDRKSQGKSEMGTTLTALHINPEGEAHIAHVGDTRVYLYRQGHMVQLTLDQNDPDAQHVLLRAIGYKPEVVPHAISVDTEDGDQFVLCSDGLNKEVTDDEIKEKLSTGDHPQTIADRLVQLANSKGGNDNITALIVRVNHKK